MNAFDIKTLLLPRVEEICRMLFPLGRRETNYFKIGGIGGEEGDSLSVCLTGSKAGVWLDGAVPDDKGDILRLWKLARRHSSMSETLKEARTFLGIPEISIKGKRFAGKVYKKPDMRGIIALSDPSAIPVRSYLLKERLLRPETVDSGMVMAQNMIGGRYDFGWSYVFQYFEPGADTPCLTKVVAIKRNAKGKKQTMCVPSGKPVLFGMNHPVVASADTFVVINEGEIDALSWIQDGVPAVSVPFGAQGETTAGESPADEWIEHCRDWLDQFQTIFLCFDQDEAGDKSASYIAKRLGKERCRRVILPDGMDANEAIIAGLSLSRFLADSKPIQSTEFASGRDLSKEVFALAKQGRPEDQGIPIFDWVFDQGYPFRLRMSEGTILTGYNGNGKSAFLYQLIAWLAACKGVKTFIGSYEQSGAEALNLMAMKALNGPINCDDPSLYTALESRLFDNVFFHNVEGNADQDEFFDLAKQAVEHHDCQVIVADSASCFKGLDLDDKASVETFVKKCQAFWRTHRVHFILVCHPRKGLNESTPPLKMDVKGSGYFTDLFFNILTIHSNKNADAPGGKFICSKQKVGGQLPEAELIYVKESTRLIMSYENPYDSNPWVFAEGDPVPD